jgi:transcriptional regulator with XRE-family HTH domain
VTSRIRAGRTIASLLGVLPIIVGLGEFDPPDNAAAQNARRAEFAKRFGLSQRTVEQWEQGRAVPDRPARILLAVIERDPRAVERVIVGSRKP